MGDGDHIVEWTRPKCDKVRFDRETWEALPQTMHMREVTTMVKDAENELVFYYNSPNELCVLLQALAQEILSHYGESAEIVETQCKKQGAEFCRIQIKFA